MKLSMVLRWRFVLASIALVILVAGCAGCPPDGGSTKASPTPSPSPSAPPTPTEMGVTVKLIEHTGTDPEKPTLTASTEANHIRWWNQTTVDRKIHFTVDWPFLETSGDITVAPGATSAWFTLNPSKVAGGTKPFPYQVNPPLASAPTDGPDEPEVSGEP